MSTASPPVLRELNQHSVLKTLRRSGTLRISEVAALTGLSRPTVTAVTRELTEAGWVTSVPTDHEERGLGRPARLVRFRAEAGHVVGIDVGGHTISVLVAQLDGTHTPIVSETIGKPGGERQILKTLAVTVQKALRQANVNPESVLAAAVGSPGIIEATAGVVTGAPGVPGWTSVDLKQAVSKALTCPIQVDNDVNLAVLGEIRHGAGQALGTVVYVLWGERIGAGISIDGHIHRGRANAAGEIGYLNVLGRTTDISINTEDLGPFERLVAGGAIARLGSRAAARLGGELSRLPEADLDAAAVFSAAQRGDRAAGEAVTTAVNRMARGLAPILLVLDPDALIIGGGLSRAGTPLLDALRDRLKRLTVVEPDLRLSSLGANAVALGAMSLALDNVEERLFPRPELARPATPPNGLA